MMLSLYVALGVFVLLARRNPSANRSLIAFTAWSSFAHAVVMTALGFQIASERRDFLFGSAVLAVIGVALIVLAPTKPPVERASAVAAYARAAERQNRMPGFATHAAVTAKQPGASLAR